MLKRYILWAGSVCATLIPLLASADSLVLTYPTNGHKYQRIDIEDQSWTVARDNCKARGGYLATITTLGENGFIKDYLFKGLSYWKSFYLGGSSTKQQGVWEWATTTEKFSYTNWASGEPNPANGQYLFMNAEYGKWYSSSDSNYGYICEWGGAAYKDFIATAAVGDMNSNGSPELATLFMDQATGKNVVQNKPP